MLWLFDETRRAVGWRHRVRWGVALASVIASATAGWPSTAFINLVGLGVYAAWPVGRWVYWYIGRLVEQRRSGLSDTVASPPLSPSTRPPLSHFLAGLLPLFAVLPAFALAAAQLLPSLEASGLGLRAEGLPYRWAASFSLRPRLLRDPAAAHGRGPRLSVGSEGYAEFVGYIGVTGLILAAIGVLSVMREDRPSPALKRLAVSSCWRPSACSWRWARTIRSTISSGGLCRDLICLSAGAPAGALCSWGGRAGGRWVANVWLRYIRSCELPRRLPVPPMPKWAFVLYSVAAPIPCRASYRTATTALAHVVRLGRSGASHHSAPAGWPALAQIGAGRTDRTDAWGAVDREPCVAVYVGDCPGRVALA